jgi:hypothetical protein
VLDVRGHAPIRLYCICTDPRSANFSNEQIDAVYECCSRYGGEHRASGFWFASRNAKRYESGDMKHEVDVKIPSRFQLGQIFPLREIERTILCCDLMAMELMGMWETDGELMDDSVSRSKLTSRK